MHFYRDFMVYNRLKKVFIYVTFIYGITPQRSDNKIKTYETLIKKNHVNKFERRS